MNDFLESSCGKPTCFIDVYFNLQAAKVPVKELEFNEKKLLNVRSALVIVLIQSE